MTLLRISEAARFLGVSDDSVRRWVASGRLSAHTDGTGRAAVDGVEVAQLVKDGNGNSKGNLNGTSDDGVPSSARNRFHGLVTDVVMDTVMAQVELQCGPFRVVSLMSAEAARDLGLEPGMPATAIVKATTVIVERMERTERTARADG
ncbi:molybdopterin-binding protein [Citricoccus sp. K5]|uniref:TOBE domain-containing protein n=1 Tax=Citricoccus sp. K5 TaxID=2653135 RepID=UPI0012F238F8|nr:TOBE domain-containing protein [Citricoccus sp. K5]VXB72754.1 Molybdopterin-binding protein [Citricoccus sp. K5]